MSTQIVRQPRWPAFVAMLAAAGVYLALPAPLSLGPSWLLLLVIALLLIPIVVSDRRGHHKEVFRLQEPRADVGARNDEEKPVAAVIGGAGDSRIAGAKHLV